MLDTVAYGAFCQRVAGDYLHHTPHYGEPHSYHDPGYAAPREAGHARTGASLSLVLQVMTAWLSQLIILCSATNLLKMTHAAMCHCPDGNAKDIRGKVRSRCA